MKIFLVNLDRDKDRMAFAGAQLAALGVEYERVSGVDGRALSADEVRASFDRFRWWCAVGRPASLGEIGCALSHYGIYRRMAEENIPLACVLEDDVVLDTEFPARGAALETAIDASRPVVAMLSDHTRQYPSGRGLVRSETGMCTDGYVITRPAAETLLDANLPVIVPCDNWWRWVKQGRLELYHSLPPVCRQNQTDFTSNMIDCHAYRLRGLFTARTILHKARRLAGKPIDMLLVRLTGK